MSFQCFGRGADDYSSRPPSEWAVVGRWSGAGRREIPSGEISAAADSKGRGPGRGGVEATGRGRREDIVFGSGRCILPPGKGSMRGSLANRVAYSSASLWHEEGEAERRASRMKTTHFS
jgi:hypothetical protein